MTKAVKKNIVDQVEKELALDPQSDRYRVCRNPECRKHFMAKNRSRDYCSDRCADTHYNFLRKYIQQNNYGDVTKKQYNVPASETDPEIKSTFPNNKPDQEWTAAYENNLKILDSLTLNPKKGTPYKVDYLIGLGYNFFCYTSRAPLFNIEPKHDAHCLILSDYKIYLIERNTILIFSKKIKPKLYDIS
jgi:hypothetical protein